MNEDISLNIQKKTHKITSNINLDMYNFHDGLPIIIICFNNYKYVDNTIKQIININPDYKKYIFILNNKSDDEKTIEYLLKNNLDVKIINNDVNEGPWINKGKNAHIFDALPDKYIITDPDLQFNKNLPKNFIEIMDELSEFYKCNKIGFAISLEDKDDMYPYENYFDNKTIYDFESKHFWNTPIQHSLYHLYEAGIDTTFSLHNKKYFREHVFYNSDNGVLMYMDSNLFIRMAGDFECKHLPFYINEHVLNVYEKYKYSIKSLYSTTSNFHLKHIKENYNIIERRNEIILTEKNDDVFFWNYYYHVYEDYLFDLFDKYLDKNKDYIDVGDAIGETSIYASRKSRNVFTFCKDISILDTLQKNCKNNSDNIIITENYEISKINKKSFLGIKIDNIENISFIKVDIQGEEEHILIQLYNCYKKYKIPIYIKIYKHLWDDATNMNFFPFLNNFEKRYYNSTKDIFAIVID